jgi:transcriptional regulator with XRE-family HTH domain
MLLSKRLRTIRRAKDLTQQELATLAGVNYVTISRIEGGDAEKVRVKTIMHLARALDVTTDELLGMDEFVFSKGKALESVPATRKSRRARAGS